MVLKYPGWGLGIYWVASPVTSREKSKHAYGLGAWTYCYVNFWKTGVGKMAWTADRQTKKQSNTLLKVICIGYDLKRLSIIKITCAIMVLKIELVLYFIIEIDSFQ